MATKKRADGGKREVSANGIEAKLTTDEMLPRMPKKDIIIRVAQPIGLRLDYDPSRYSSGSMRMKFSDTSVTVSRDGVDLGTVEGVLGGGIQVCFEKGRSWFITAEWLWKLALAAEEVYVGKKPDPLHALLTRLADVHPSDLAPSLRDLRTAWLEAGKPGL